MNVVLGHYPEYTALTARLGANCFSVPEHIWDRLSDQQQWELNRRYLETHVVRPASQLVFSLPPQDARPNSAFEREIDYLVSRGVAVAPNLNAFLP